MLLLQIQDLPSLLTPRDLAEREARLVRYEAAAESLARDCDACHDRNRVCPAYLQEIECPLGGLPYVPRTEDLVPFRSAKGAVHTAAEEDSPSTDMVSEPEALEPAVLNKD